MIIKFIYHNIVDNINICSSKVKGSIQHIKDDFKKEYYEFNPFLTHIETYGYMTTYFFNTKNKIRVSAMQCNAKKKITW